MSRQKFCIITGRHVEVPEIELDKVKIAWCAAFYIGEGTTVLWKSKGKCAYLRMQICQIDIEALEIFRKTFICGKIYGPYKRWNRNNLSYYEYKLYDFEEVQYVMALMWPYLTKRKKAQYREACHEYLSRR